MSLLVLITSLFNKLIPIRNFFISYFSTLNIQLQNMLKKYSGTAIHDCEVFAKIFDFVESDFSILLF